MAVGFLETELSVAIGLYLDFSSMLEYATSARCLRHDVAAIVNQMLAHDFGGMQLCHRPSFPRRSSFVTCAKMRRVLQPKVFLTGQLKCWPQRTLLFPMSLNSEGPFFWSWTILASHALNGMPTVGVVDGNLGSLSARPGGGVPMDLSRHQPEVLKLAGGVFAISCHPGDGRLHAILPTSGVQALRGNACEWIHQQELPEKWKLQGTHAGWLGWDQTFDESKSNTTPAHIGIFVHKRALTFYRFYQPDQGDAYWQSSAVVCDHLPSDIIPCIFMFSFVGYADVRFLGLGRTPPENSRQ